MNFYVQKDGNTPEKLKNENMVKNLLTAIDAVDNTIDKAVDVSIGLAFVNGELREKVAQRVAGVWITRPRLVTLADFKAMDLKDKVITILSINNPSYRLTYKRAMDQDEKAAYEAAKKEKDDAEKMDRERRFYDAAAAEIDGKITFYNDCIGKFDLIIGVVKAWDGKRLNKNFEKAIYDALTWPTWRPCKELTCIDSVSFDGTNYFVSNSSRLVLCADKGDVRVNFISLINGKGFTIKGKTARLDASAVVDNLIDNKNKILSRIATLEAYKGTVCAHVNRWNQAVKDLQAILDSMPVEYRYTYAKALDKAPLV